MLLLLIKRHPPVSDLHWHQRCWTSTLGWAIKLGSSLYSPFFFHFQTAYQIILSVLRSINLPAGAARRNVKSVNLHSLPRLLKLLVCSREVLISPQPHIICSRKTGSENYLLLASLNSQAGGNQLNIRNIFANSATPCLPREVITAERNPPERTNYISAQTG